MDTIEISNLNRQFLFRKRHVGKSKAETAAEAVRSFCPDANIKTLQQNVKDSLFDLAFMKTFDIVLNGLDNDEARRHVNRLCLAADVPLIESGTTGYKGQVCSIVAVTDTELSFRPGRYNRTSPLRIQQLESMKASTVTRPHRTSWEVHVSWTHIHIKLFTPS